MARRYKCPYCDDKYERKDLIEHIDKKHEDLIPENFTSTRIVFNLINKRECGFCRVCNKETKWREDLGRYDVLCENPKCKEELRRRYQENMIRVRGTDNILNDPEQQKKMLANRSISGKYKFTDGGVLTFTGSYEKKCLEFMDKVLEIPSKDILSPGPTLEYEMNGEKHFYITDFYLIPQNLIIEVKDGGDNLNTKDSPGMRSSRERTLAKEKLITESGEYNYVRLTNNDFAQLIDVLMEIKKAQFDKRDGKIIKVNESYINESGNNINLYHLSTNNLDSKILKPRIPDNFLVKNGYENSTIKRVCFATSIDKCLRAMSYNIKGIEFYVHIPDKKYNTYKPSVKEVPDCKITGEIWIREPVKLKCIGKIKVIKDKGEPGLKYQYGDKEAELYDWDYEWVEKINESYINESLDIDFNTPEELSNWMKKNIKYKEYDKLMSAQEVYDAKRGSCHDQVIFEDEMFKKMKIKHGKLFFIEYNEGEQQGGKTHTLLYYIKDNKYYWFENAWGGEEGIHGPYDSLSSLKDDVKEKNMKNSNYNNIEFSTVKNIKTGMNLGEYVGACLKQAESYINEGIIDNYRFLDVKKDKSEVLKYLKKSNMSYAEDIIKNYIGEIIVDKDKMIGRIFVGNKKDKGFIVDLEVSKTYRGQKLGNKLIDDAIKKYNGIDLLVDKDNEIALSMYKKRGFVIVKEINNQYYMKLKSKLTKDDKTVNESYINEANFINDKGEKVPKICPKCGSKVGLYFRGEPVYLCSKCNEYFGVPKFSIKEATEEDLDYLNNYIL